MGILKKSQSRDATQLGKAFSELIVDMMDHYDEYSDQEKTDISNLFQTLLEYNEEHLEKYDKKKKDNIIAKVKDAFLRVFGHE